MRPRAKPVSSLSARIVPDSEADLDDLDSLLAETKPFPPTIKRARGRPAGGGSNIAKAVPKVLLGSKRKAETAPTTVEKRQAREGKKGTTKTSEAENEEVQLEIGADDGCMEVKSPKVMRSRRGRPKTLENRTAPKTVRSTIPELLAAHHSRPPSPEIPEIRAVGVLSRDASEELPVAIEEPLELDNETKLNMTLPENKDDALLRKMLQDLSKKYKNLETRHRALRDTGIKIAEHNFDCIKKQAEENFRASNELISQLKADLADQSGMTEECEDLRHQIEHSEKERNCLEDMVNDMRKALCTARSEIATLTAKLSASRGAEVNAMVPGSTSKLVSTKPGSMAYKTEMSELKQIAQAKEDLYGDLTGLIVRGMRREEEEDVFDCIQTGRNGTLHFKLALERGTHADNYESIQLTYKPQLDNDRDNDLIELLPDYLVEEITFPRSHASKFYSRVMKSLSERVERD